MLVGAYWYPWYGSGGRHWQEGYRGTPLLGEYDSADPDVIRQQIAWASDYGVDFFATSWWGQDSYEDAVTRGPFLEGLAGQELRFAILYEAPGLLGMDGGKIPVDDPGVRQRLTDDFTYLAQVYFDHPGYLRIDDRPVVFIYLTRAFVGNVREALSEIRAAVKAESDIDPFIVGDEVYWQSPTRLRLGPYDGVTAYNMHTSVPGIADGFAAKVGDQYSVWASAAAREDIAFVPDVIPGFDDTAVRPEAGHPTIPRSPELFAEQLEDALVLASGPARMVMITSWNEWHEDTSIEPGDSFGFDYLEILRDQVTAAREIP